MTRLTVLVLVALAAALVGGVSAGTARGLAIQTVSVRADSVRADAREPAPHRTPEPADVTPTLPWAVDADDAADADSDAAGADDTADDTADGPTRFPRMADEPPPPAEPPAPLTTREMPALEVVGSRWYEEERRDLSRLYLDRLLLGEIVAGWSWDAGFNIEQSIGAQEASVLTERFEVGFEGRMQRTTEKDSDGKFEEAIMIGPSMRWRPSARTNVDVAPLVGVGGPYSMSEVCLAYCWKF